MAFCTKCGHEISAEAVACPECGQPTGFSAAAGELADFWTRLGAALLDSLILVIPGLVLRFGSPFGGFFLVSFLYHWLTVAYWEGQTVGKRVLGIRVLRADGTALDSALAAGRSAMRIVSGIPFALGFLWAAWDPQRRTWHDLVCDTRVFRL